MSDIEETPLDPVILALIEARDTAIQAHALLTELGDDASAFKAYAACEMAEAATHMLITHLAMQEVPSDEEMNDFLRLVPPPVEEYDS